VENIVVGIAEWRVGTAGQALSTYALGSCVALAVHDPVAAVGGLLHFMLPDSHLDALRARERPGMFADTGIAFLLDALQRRGADRRRLVAQAAGAASILDPEGVFDIGVRNYEALHRILDNLRIPLTAEACGGNRSRSVRLEIDSGRVVIQEGGVQVELARAAPSQGGAKACLSDARFGF
jgi:chemotaxis protein CheD